MVILPSNMTVEGVLKEHWRNPHKVKVRLRRRRRSPLRGLLPPNVFFFWFLFKLDGISRPAPTSSLGCSQHTEPGLCLPKVTPVFVLEARQHSPPALFLAC